MNLKPDVERVALLGWHLYPASARSRAACIKNPTHHATCDLATLSRWQNEFPNCNWRVVVGPSRIWGLDVDVPPGHAHDGAANLAKLVKFHRIWPLHPLGRSGGGGFFHVFAHHDEPIIGDAGCPALGIDPRRGRQSQTIPPSRHIRTGKPYVWIVPPWGVPAPPAPSWLLRLVRPAPPPPYPPPPIPNGHAATAALIRACNAVAISANGNHNNTLNRRAYHMGRLIASGLIAEGQVFDALYAVALLVGQSSIEATATIRSGIAAGIRTGPT